MTVREANRISIVIAQAFDMTALVFFLVFLSLSLYMRMHRSNNRNMTKWHHYLWLAVYFLRLVMADVH